MKKLLLSMAFATAAFGFASANEATVTFSSLGLANAKDVAVVKANDDITLTFSKGTNSNGPKYYTTGTAVRFYGSNTLTISGAEGVDITEVVFTTAANGKDTSYQISSESKVTEGTLVAADQTSTWTGSANSFTLTQGGTKGHARIQTIKISYTGGTGAGEPTIPEVEVKEYANIAAFLAAKDDKSQSKITSPVTAIYQNGRNLYITDDSGNLLVYGDLNTKYNNGDVIPAGITGTYKDFNGLIEFDAPDKASFTAATAGTAVEPEEVTIEELASDMMSKYIVIKNVTIKATETANSYTMTDETGTVTLYNTFNNAQYFDLVEVKEGSELTVVGFVGIRNGAVQINPVSVTGNSTIETVATPTFNPESGVVAAGTEVTISCATEGATIYYTLDKSTPSSMSTVYSAPIVVNEATHIRAIAVKDGMLSSSIAEGNYTIEISGATEGDTFFNFAKASTLDPAVQEPVAGNEGDEIKLDNINFTNNGVSLMFKAADDPNATATRMWYDANKGPQARLYKNGTITISAPEGKAVNKVVFNGDNIGRLEYKGTAITDNTWTGDAEPKVEFISAGGRTDIYTIAVYITEDAGVNDVEINNAAVEYFNLQGVRVENPTSGLYIRRQGNNVSKVVL